MGTNMQDIQFLSTLSLRRATLLFWGEQYGGKISIHALLAESDGASNNPQHLPLAISIHALLAESDHVNPAQRAVMAAFLSTLSLRRATKPGHSFHVGIGHFYPRSPCGERPVVYGAGFAHGEISIHALLAESDQGLPHLDIRALDFYPRSPCGERRRKQQVHELWLGFLSTLSLRRATICGRSATTCARFLSTLSLRRATGAALWRADRLADFYPRSPCGERPGKPSVRKASRWISIHALLAESDRRCPATGQTASHFYPRSPCGERPMMLSMGAILILFLSTLSLRRATPPGLLHSLGGVISIHALLAESDKADSPTKWTAT